MRGAVLYGPHDVRFEEREVPKIIKPTDAVIKIAAACVWKHVLGDDMIPSEKVRACRQTMVDHQ